MVYRIYVEKKPGLDNEAAALLKEADSFLGLKGLEELRTITADHVVPELRECTFRVACVDEGADGIGDGFFAVDDGGAGFSHTVDRSASLYGENRRIGPAGAFQMKDALFAVAGGIIRVGREGKGRQGVL